MTGLVRALVLSAVLAASVQLLLTRLSIGDEGAAFTSFDPLCLALTSAFFISVAVATPWLVASDIRRPAAGALWVISVGIWVFSFDILGGAIAYGPLVVALSVASPQTAGGNPRGREFQPGSAEVTTSIRRREASTADRHGQKPPPLTRIRWFVM